jgi:hypothetical protein
MRILKYAALLGILLFAAASAQGQVAVRVGVGPVVAGARAIGPEPVCAYGYYRYYPYACAPYGYWGPTYFIGGVFVGVGPWYHAHWGPGYWGRGYYGHGYYGRPGWGYRPGYGYGRPANGGPVHGFVGGYAGYHGSSSAGFHGGGGGGYHGGGGGFHGGGGHGGGHR